MNTPDSFKEEQIDVLKEIGNIGIGNALSSLSVLINKRVNMEVPQAGFYPIERIIQRIGGYEEQVSCIIFRVTGETQCSILFVFDSKSTFCLLEMIKGEKQDLAKEIGDYDESIIKEVGNILAGSYITALCSLTGLKQKVSVPMFAFDMLGAVLSTSLAVSGYVQEKVLSIETSLFSGQEKIRGNFLVLLEPESLEKLYTALGLA